MKIVLVHDYLKEYGGAERVLETLHEMYPDAPVFTCVYLPQFLGPHRDRFNGWDIRTSIAQLLPFKERLISPLRIIAPLLFRSFDFSGFGVIIVSATGAYSPNIIHHKSAIHISYTHTPPRYLYGFATAREWKKNPVLRVIGEMANMLLRIVDKNSAKNVDYFIANSKNVASRIKKFYGCTSTVIYPPVEMPVIKKLSNEVIKDKKKSNYQLPITNYYYLAGGRLARPKHIDLITRACAQLDVPLKVFGRGFAGYGEEIRDKQQATSNTKIEFVGEVTDEEKLELMRGAKAYIFAGEDEDFGITPVEAMSMGTPVIAYRSGGVIESVIEGKTGLFFDELTVESLTKVIKKLSKSVIKAEDCIERARKFSKERFKTEIQLFVDKVISK